MITLEDQWGEFHSVDVLYEAQLPILNEYL
jgi:hypothetical protein